MSQLPRPKVLAAVETTTQAYSQSALQMTNKKRIIVADQGLISIVRFIDKKIVDSGTIEALGDELNSLVTEENETQSC